MSMPLTEVKTRKSTSFSVQHFCLRTFSIEHAYMIILYSIRWIYTTKFAVHKWLVCNECTPLLPIFYTTFDYGQSFQNVYLRANVNVSRILRDVFRITFANFQVHLVVHFLGQFLASPRLIVDKLLKV